MEQIKAVSLQTKKTIINTTRIMNELFSVKDQVIVITGGTGVLGRCIAKYLAKEGAKVVVMGRKADIGNEIVNDQKAQGRSHVPRY